MSGSCRFIDTHAHLDDQRFDEDRDCVIDNAMGAGLEYIITVGCWSSDKGFKPAIEIAERYAQIYASIGVHPHDSGFAGEGVFQELITSAENDKVVAVGETGLDYHYDNSPRDAQRRAFAEHINISRQLALPLIIHTREADDDTFAILKGEGGGEVGGVFHCFSGSYNVARKCLDMGFLVSFSGLVTFPKAYTVHETVKRIPIEKMIIETDCPYLAPQPYRGKRNEPRFVLETARRIAELKGLSLVDVARITTRNAKGLFGIGSVEERAEIAYRIRDSLYLNVTNRCTNSCKFCAKYTSFTVKGHYLRLSHEPDLNELLGAIGPEPQRYKEIVFCGYGEPLIRLELVKKAGLFLKRMGCHIRIDTDGLANLVHGKNVLPELMFVDEISVSLNAPDSETYQKLIKTPYGDKAFPGVVWFLREAKRYISKVTATVVAVPGLDVEACRRLAEEEIGVKFRVREFNEVG